MLILIYTGLYLQVPMVRNHIRQLLYTIWEYLPSLLVHWHTHLIIDYPHDWQKGFIFLRFSFVSSKILIWFRPSQFEFCDYAFFWCSNKSIEKIYLISKLQTGRYTVLQIYYFNKWWGHSESFILDILKKT